MPQIPALPFIRGAITQGLSGNQAYRQYQALAREQTAATGERWSGMRRNTFQVLYSQTRAIRQNVPSAIEAPKDKVPEADDIDARSYRHGKGYLNWATVFVRAPGTNDVEPYFHAIRSEEPLTPGETEQRAEAAIMDAIQQAHGSLEGYVFHGSLYTGTERLVPPVE